MFNYFLNKVYILYLKIKHFKVVLLNKNQIKIKGNIRNIKLDINGYNNHIIIDKNSQVINTTIYIRGYNHTLFIGENCKIYGGELWFEDNDCLINISMGTTVESAHIAVTEPKSIISLGKDCMLAKEVVIRSGDSHSVIEKESLKRINFANNVIIEEHVWIASRAIILKGVTVGRNSVISTGSIVTKDVSANTIVGGNPARILKSDVNWTRERLY
jgi:acetyltransferase-like isoleucine patch superfamily enzyme